jgi:phospholipid/cholesterol/gamma-HCH transport system substrate-binding protein
MNKSIFETIVGFVVLVVVLVFFLLVLNTSRSVKKNKGYTIVAEFNNVEGLTIGNDVKISGVKVGGITKIELNDNYSAVVHMNIENKLKIPIDSIFKVSSSGLMGGKFINIKIGADEFVLENNSIAEFTESTMDLEDLITRFVLGGKDEK